jgi:Uma2 family endonuclease
MVVIEDRVMVPHAALDHDGYRDWVKSDEYADYPASLRTTFVVGEVLVEMTPESIERHNQVRAALGVVLGTFVAEHDLGTIYPDGALITNETAGLSCEPDFTFVAWQTFEDGRVRLVERTTGPDFIEILGSPDLVVEVVSDSSVRKDTRLLRQAYFRADIREYWLIDARGADIKFEILVRGDTGFVARAESNAAQPSNVFGGRWRLTRFRNRVGQFAYRLDRTA